MLNIPSLVLTITSPPYNGHLCLLDSSWGYELSCPKHADHREEHRDHRDYMRQPMAFPRTYLVGKSPQQCPHGRQIAHTIFTLSASPFEDISIIICVYAWMYRYIDRYRYE